MKTYTEEKRIRPDILTAAVYWSVVIVMIYHVISVRIFGDMGSGFCSGTIALYFLLYVSFILAVQKAVYIMVRIRARRSQFINAQINMERTMRNFTGLGIILALIIGFSSFNAAKALFGSGKVYFQLIIIAICLFLMCSQGVLRGYMQGLGYTRPIVIADLVVAISSFVSGAVISVFLYNYGKKVNNLFHGNVYSAIYGASGMMIGLLIGSVIGFIQITVSFLLRKKEIEAIVKDGAPRYLDNKNDVYKGIRPIVYLYASPLLMCLVDNIVYNITQIKEDNVEQAVSAYGAYSGRVITPAILLAFLSCIPFIKSWNRVMARYERDEIEGARDRFRKLVRFTLILLIPVMVGYLVSSEDLQIAIYGKKSAAIGGSFALGAVLYLLLALAVLTSWMLNHMGKNLVVIICLTASWAVHAICLVISVIAHKEIIGIVFGQILAFLIYDIMSLYLLFRLLKIRFNFVLYVGIPLGASAVSGLLLFGIIKVLSSVIGEILTLLIGIVIYTVVYVLIMIALKGLRTHELGDIPLGKFFTTFSTKVQNDKFYEE